ncbi:MAG: DNA polymerase III subunit beta [Bacteroidetes bacterium]|nr:DNA polymerase III subunit beta [Bacteroidota bacterium]
MKTAVDVKALKTGLKVIGKVPRNSTIPAIENVVIEATETGTCLSLTDLETVTKVQLANGLNGETEPGTVLINKSTFTDLLKNVKSGLVTLTETEAGCVVEAGGISTSLSTFPADEYPSARPIAPKHEIDIDAATLRGIIRACSPFVSRDEYRKSMTGIVFEVNPDGTLTGVSTDGHRLRVAGVLSTAMVEQKGHVLKVPQSTALYELNVPLTQTLDRVLSITEKYTGPVHITVGLFRYNDETPVDTVPDAVEFRIPTATVQGRLIMEPHPDYRVVMPDDNTLTLKVAKQSLLSVTKSLLPVTDKITHCVKLATSSASVGVEASDDGKTATGKVSQVDWNGPAKFEIGFNAAYLIEMLESIDAELVTLEFISPTRAVNVKVDGRPDIYGLIMPLRLT